MARAERDPEAAVLVLAPGPALVRVVGFDPEAIAAGPQPIHAGRGSHRHALIEVRLLADLHEVAAIQGELMSGAGFADQRLAPA